MRAPSDYIGHLHDDLSLRALCSAADVMIVTSRQEANRIDAQRLLSMTYDQGKEMSQHEKRSERTGVKVHFADPHSPWQRRINENTNGLLRQYLPKGIDLSVFSRDELDSVAWALNTRPRKASDSNALLNSFYLIHLMPTSITAGLLRFTLETAAGIT